MVFAIDEEERRIIQNKANEIIKKSSINVIVYSTPNCPYCRMSKQYLTQRGIKFVDYDVSVDVEKAREMIEKSGQMGVPVIDINGTIIIGFDKPRIDFALRNI